MGSSAGIQDIDDKDYGARLKDLEAAVGPLREAHAQAQGELATRAQQRDLTEAALAQAQRELAEARAQGLEQQRAAAQQRESDAYHGRRPGANEGLAEIATRLLGTGTAGAEAAAEAALRDAEERHQRAIVASNQADQRRAAFAAKLRFVDAELGRLTYDRQRAKVLRGEVPPPVVVPKGAPAWAHLVAPEQRAGMGLSADTSEATAPAAAGPGKKR